MENIFTKRRVALDLLGQKFDGWTFESLEELKDIEIEKRNQKENHAGVLVKCDLVGIRSGNRRTLNPVLIYELKGDHWILLGLTSRSSTANSPQ